jgi:hypothetical protein
VYSGDYDKFWVQLLPYNDGINGYEYWVTAAGVQMDFKKTGDRSDVTWNEVWESEVTWTNGSLQVLIKPILRKNTVKRGTMIALILSQENMTQAFHQVRKNKGAAGVDGISVNDLAAALRQRWPSIKQQVENGSYQPNPILGAEIPKPNGKKRLFPKRTRDR